MRAVLTGPLLVAAGVLLISGLAKLRSPGAAITALRAGGLPAAALLVPAAAGAELVVGLAVAFAPGRPVMVALTVLYAGLSATAWILARRQVACGCFGHADAPATHGGAALNAGVALVAAAGIAWPAHGLAWVLEASPGVALALVIGIGGCVYAVVTLYTQLPAAWTAWSGR